MPGGLGHDPRLWQREDVAVFMRYCEREFDLDKIDMDKFQMNGELVADGRTRTGIFTRILCKIEIMETLRKGHFESCIMHSFIYGSCSSEH